MSNEWPIRPAEPAAPEELLLPLALHEHVELILASSAVRAFAEKRAQQLLEHGHSPENDARLTIDRLVEYAATACVGYIERTGRFRMMNPPAEIRELLLRKIDMAGALLLAARDRLLMDVPESDSD